MLGMLYTNSALDNCPKDQDEDNDNGHVGTTHAALRRIRPGQLLP